MADLTVKFPLYERAEERGLLDGRSGLILAPTATGKSYIGRTAINRALERGTGRTHVYLVPYRALANEIYESFEEQLSGTDSRLRVVTGDYRDPIRPEDADLIVATYESFAGLLRLRDLRPGLVVADEVHLIADDTRGPVVEGLFARLLATGRAHALLGLSAVIENGEEMARWLGVELLAGTEEDRPVPLTLHPKFVENVDEALADVLRPCCSGEQGLVFCSSRSGAERVARDLVALLEKSISASDRSRLRELAAHLEEQHGDEVGQLLDVLQSGVAYHHAGLPRDARRDLERAFADRLIRLIACTPTLAAGVNLPASVAVVRDIHRTEVVRGVHRRVLLPSGEILNMLGRAARPHRVQSGAGVALIDTAWRSEPRVKELVAALKARKGGRVTSQLPHTFEGLMRFVLAVVAERGEAGAFEVVAAYEKTFAHHIDQRPVSFERPFKEDMMEDLPEYEKVRAAGGAIRLEAYQLSPAGVHASVRSKHRSRDNTYEVTLSVSAISCSCPAASQFYRGRICKHQACAIHDLLFDPEIKRKDPEPHYRAVYNCGHVFGEKLDPGTRLTLALEILNAWGLLEGRRDSWRPTSLGVVAAVSGFDLLLVHQAAQRTARTEPKDHIHVAMWAIEDYFEKEEDEQRWQRTLRDWLEEVEEKKISLPTRYRGDFERGLEDLSRVCQLYAKAAEALGKAKCASLARDAAASLRYGVAPDLVPLMALALPQLGRARARLLYEKGIRTVHDLVNADAEQLVDPQRLPAPYLRDWIARAQEIHRAKAVAEADRERADQEFDELVTRFRLDPEALKRWP